MKRIVTLVSLLLALLMLGCCAAVAEEAPVVKETPAVEVAPAAEEEPAVEEEPSVEEPPAEKKPAPKKKTSSKKKAAKDEERNRAKRRENLLILKSIDAVGKLTYADAIAIRDGKTNGEMKEAIEVYKEADKELYEFLLEQTTKI